MKYILIFVMIICIALFASAQDTPEVVNIVPEPVPEQIFTQLTLTLIDEVSNQRIELENSVVQIMGELRICEDSFTYSNTFTDGNMYEMIIWIKRR